MAAVRQSTRRQQFVLVVDLAELSFYKVAHMDSKTIYVTYVIVQTCVIESLCTYSFFFTHVAINVVTQIFQDYEDNYPERLKSAFIINSNFISNLSP